MHTEHMNESIQLKAAHVKYLLHLWRKADPFTYFGLSGTCTYHLEVRIQQVWFWPPLALQRMMGDLCFCV